MLYLVSKYSCALQLHNAILGGKWKLRILWHIHHGDTRFSTLKRGIPEISEKILAQQLRELEEHQLIKRRVVTVMPPHVVYELSPDYPTLPAMLEVICEFAHGYAKAEGIKVED